jgi:hypothetical protein
MSNQFKYYSPETYNKYSGIVESAKEIEQRLKKHEYISFQNNKQVEAYREEWKQRTFVCNSFKSYFKTKSNLDNVNFIDD